MCMRANRASQSLVNTLISASQVLSMWVSAAKTVVSRNKYRYFGPDFSRLHTPKGVWPWDRCEASQRCVPYFSPVQNLGRDTPRRLKTLQSHTQASRRRPNKACQTNGMELNDILVGFRHQGSMSCTRRQYYLGVH